jgi:hypothetical protein
VGCAAHARPGRGTRGDPRRADRGWRPASPSSSTTGPASSARRPSARPAPTPSRDRPKPRSRPPYPRVLPSRPGRGKGLRNNFSFNYR